MHALKTTLAALAIGVGSLFGGLGTADAQWGYRAYRPYSGYYSRPYRSYRAPVYRSYRTYPYGGYYSRGYYGGGRGYYGGSGVYVSPGGIGIRF